MTTGISWTSPNPVYRDDVLHFCITGAVDEDWSLKLEEEEQDPIEVLTGTFDETGTAYIQVNPDNLPSPNTGLFPTRTRWIYEPATPNGPAQYYPAPDQSPPYTLRYWDDAYGFGWEGDYRPSGM